MLPPDQQLSTPGCAAEATPRHSLIKDTAEHTEANLREGGALCLVLLSWEERPCYPDRGILLRVYASWGTGHEAEEGGVRSVRHATLTGGKEGQAASVLHEPGAECTKVMQQRSCTKFGGQQIKY